MQILIGVILVSYHLSVVPQNGPAGTNLSMLSRNPLGQTHEFRQACHACYSRIGPFQVNRGGSKKKPKNQTEPKWNS